MEKVLYIYLMNIAQLWNQIVDDLKQFQVTDFNHDWSPRIDESMMMNWIKQEQTQQHEKRSFLTVIEQTVSPVYFPIEINDI